MNAVIYARFSSHSQREQSIEGQLKTCYKFAADNGYTVIGEYIDRAQSGTNDNRAEFQRMIADSDKHTFNAVIVYQLDRFARNRYDSAINKAKLKKNGVRVVSARENITDDASGILVEGILESMAEYYSAELSQKIHRGMSLNAQKCLSNGSNPGLGFKVAPDHTFYVDEDEAVIVREIFERYGKGETVTDIIKDLNARQIKTSLGRDFNKNSLHRLLRNKRYIGTYLYKGEETPGGMPRIVNNEVFERVQSILDKNKAAPARSRGKEEYLLTTKLFCGYCHEMMTGYGGTGKSGKAYLYYACKNAKKHLCQKKVVDKKRIEDMVVATCRQMLTDSNIQRIAEAIEAVFKSEFDSSAMKRIKSAIQEADTAIENLWQALEKGQSVDTIMERINKRQEEKAELEAQLAIEAKKERIISAQEVTHFLSVLQKSNFDDPLNRRAVINIFLNKIYLYDDKFRLVLNGSGQPVEIDDIMLDEIDDYFDSQISDSAECSSMVADAPPGGIRTPGLWNRNRIRGLPLEITGGRLIPRKVLYSCGFRRFSACVFRVVRSPPEKRVFQKVLEKILEVFARGSPSLLLSHFPINKRFEPFHNGFHHTGIAEQLDKESVVLFIPLGGKVFELLLKFQPEHRLVVVFGKAH